MQQPQPLQQPQDPAQHARPPYASPSGSSDALHSGHGDFPFAHDDCLIGPRSPGSALVRLLQVEARLPESFAGERAAVAAAREDLAQAVAVAGQPEALQHALGRAQEVLQQVWEAVGTDAARRSLGFPAAMKAEEVEPVDLSTLVVTHVRPARQVLTTIAFADAPNATGYRLFETRLLPNGEDYEDSTVTSLLPAFPRVRLAAGEHRFRIESRNAHARAMSEYFTVSVPAP